MCTGQFSAQWQVRPVVALSEVAVRMLAPTVKGDRNPPPFRRVTPWIHPTPTQTVQKSRD